MVLRKNRWPIIAAIVVGLLVAGGAIYFLLQFAGSYQETAQIVVPKSHIAAYETITEEKLDIKAVPAGSVGNGVATDAAQILGKVTAADLFPGEQIRLERLADSALIDVEKQQVAINVNLTRSVGKQVSPGDLVDVYWVQSDAVPGALMTTDAVVLALMDEAGKDVRNSGGTIANLVSQPAAASESQTGLPQIAVLSVNPRDVAQLVRGSADGNANMVLVKKLKEGGTHLAAPAAENENRPQEPVRGD